MPFVTDSRYKGYLGPVSADPLYDDALDDFFHDVVAGITGMDNTLIRPRWQDEPPNIPDFAITWAAIGITIAADWVPYIVHDPTGNGMDVLHHHETLTMNCSFYGDRASHFAGYLRDGIYLDQNRAVFRANGIGLVEVTPFVRVPEKFRERWRDRVDTDVVMRREIQRTYNVMNILRVKGLIKSGAAGASTTFDTNR